MAISALVLEISFFGNARFQGIAYPIVFFKNAFFSRSNFPKIGIEKCAVSSYESKEKRVSGNNEQQVSAEMDIDEFNKTSSQIEPDNSNAEQSDDTYN